MYLVRCRSSCLSFCFFVDFTYDYMYKYLLPNIVYAHTNTTCIFKTVLHAKKSLNPLPRQPLALLDEKL